MNGRLHMCHVERWVARDVLISRGYMELARAGACVDCVCLEWWKYVAALLESQARV